MYFVGGGGPLLNQKVTVNLSSPANTVCANKDGTKVAVAGRKSININNY